MGKVDCLLRPEHFLAYICGSYQPEAIQLALCRVDHATCCDSWCAVPQTKEGSLGVACQWHICPGSPLIDRVKVASSSLCSAALQHKTTLTQQVHARRPDLQHALGFGKHGPVRLAGSTTQHTTWSRDACQAWQIYNTGHHLVDRLLSGWADLQHSTRLWSTGSCQAGQICNTAHDLVNRFLSRRADLQYVIRLEEQGLVRQHKARIGQSDLQAVRCGKELRRCFAEEGFEKRLWLGKAGHRGGSKPETHPFADLDIHKCQRLSGAGLVPQGH